MTRKKTLSAGARLAGVILLLGLFTGIFPAWAEEDNRSAQLEHFMSRLVRNISPQQAIDYLVQAKVGTASVMPGTNMILVTAEPGELIKAKAILELVDSKQPYIIETLSLPAELPEQPLYELVNERLKHTGISVGSFRETPAKEATIKALVDIHNKQIMIVAPAEQKQLIISAINEILYEKEHRTEEEISKPSEVNIVDANITEKPAGVKIRDANTPENDEFFEKLMQSLAEAEKIEAQLRAEKTEPNQQATLSSESAELDKTQKGKQPGEPTTEAEHSRIIELQPGPNEPGFQRLSYEPQDTELADETLELDLPETINIVDLIDLVGKYLNLDLLYDPGELKGTVSLRVQDKIKVGELYPLLESVLKFRGFVMSRKGNLVTIVPKSKVLEIDPVLLDDQKGPLRYGDVIVTRIFNLRYIDTDSAKNLLENMKLGVNISGIETAKKLIVTGYAYRMKRVEELLSLVDRPGEIKQFRFRQLRHTMASNLASQIKRLAEQLGTVSITIAETAPEPTPVRRPTRGTPAPPSRAQPQPSPTPSAELSVYLDADERTNRILMIGLAEQLDMVEKLIDALDVEQRDLRTLRLYDIQYVGAEEVRDKLEELGIINPSPRTSRTTRPSGRITPTVKRPQTESATETEEVVVTEEGLVEKPTVVIIEPTNSLLVNATAEQHAQIATIIGYVDVEPEQAATNYVVYPLENQDPTELATILNQLIQETIEETGEDSKVVKTTRKKLEEDITIIPDPKTYSLVVYASKKNQQWISSLIKSLDEYRPQVLLDVTLVEITKNDEFNYDLNLISSFPDLVNTSGITGTIIGGDNPIKSSDIISKLQQKNMDRFIDLQSNSGAGTAFYADKHINMLLTAIQTKDYGRILARPKLLVNDNEEGTIEAKETTYVTREKIVTITNEQGSPDYITEKQFDPYESGIKLGIMPHISKGDQLRLQITLNRTDFRITESVLSEGKPPDQISSDVSTVVTVPDNHTIILGGLERINQSKGGSKVPILGDVPIVGGLFRNIANTDDQSRLYVFVKAHIIRPGEEFAGSDMETVSAKNRKVFEKYEKEMQEYEDWPGIKPKPMDPLKVLEAD